MTSSPGRAVRFGAGFAAVGAGPSQAADLEAATRQAVAEAVQLLAQPPDLLAVFASSPAESDLEPVGALAQELSGAAHVIGCSAAGVSGARHAVLGEAGVSAWAGVTPDLRMRAFHLEVMRTEEGLAVVGLPEPRDETAALMFADPHSFPVVSFVERSGEVLPGVALIGGVAGGPAGSGSTRLYLDGRTTSRGAVGLLLAGDVGRIAVSQGCRPVGTDMIVTAAEGNVILELAGAPALSRLREAMAELTGAERAAFAAGPQVGIAMDEYADEHAIGDYLIRAVIGVDPEREAVAVSDIVAVGRSVRFQLRDAEAARADLRARLGPLAPAEGALLISCNGRGPSMFGRADSDVCLVSDVLGGAAVGGLFAGGELGPVGGQNWLHGFTASVLAFQ